MSTTLRNVTSKISQTRFSGGADRGACVQVTQKGLRGSGLPFNTGFIQLTRNDAALLAAELLRFAAGEEVEDLGGGI